MICFKREETHFPIVLEDYIRSLKQEKYTAQKLTSRQRIKIPHFLNIRQVLNFVLSGFCLSLFVKNCQLVTNTTIVIQNLSQSDKTKVRSDSVRPDTQSHPRPLSLEYHFKSFIICMKSNEKIPKVNVCKRDILLSETYIIS